MTTQAEDSPAASCLRNSGSGATLSRGGGDAPANGAEVVGLVPLGRILATLPWNVRRLLESRTRARPLPGVVLTADFGLATLEADGGRPEEQEL